MKIIKCSLLSFMLFTLFTCSSDDNPDRYCEVVINADGPGFLKVINELNSKIEVYLP